MRKSLLFFSLTVLAAVACNTLDEPYLTEVHELTVSLPKVDNKQMYWQNGDVISVGNKTKSTSLSGVTSKTNTAVFTFENPVTAGAVVRFPAVEDASRIKIPSEIVTVPGQLSEDAFPMFGTVALTGEQAPKLELRSVMAVFKLSVLGDASISKITVEAPAGESLNGVFNMSQMASPVLEIMEAKLQK